MGERTGAPSDGALAGRVGLITGGNRGIGRAIALAFAAEGADVALAARDLGASERVAGEVEALGRGALAVRCDHTRAADAEVAVQATLERFGRLDVLVNNAGASPYDKPFLEYAEDEWDAVVAANLKGPMLTCRAAGPSLLSRAGASVINVSSIAGDTPIPGESAYSAAKAGLISLTRSLAQEWSPHGVRVNCIAPGYVRTEINRGVWGPLEPHLAALQRGEAVEAADAELAASLSVYGRTAGRTPLARYGTPEEIAALAVFLASDAASFVTGAVFFADGGWQSRR